MAFGCSVRWPLLMPLLNTASGRTWVSLHQCGALVCGFSADYSNLDLALCCRSRTRMIPTEEIYDSICHNEHIEIQSDQTRMPVHAINANSCARQHQLDLPMVKAAQYRIMNRFDTTPGQLDLSILPSDLADNVIILSIHYQRCRTWHHAD